jgi:hypothetical protein
MKIPKEEIQKILDRMTTVERVELACLILIDAMRRLGVEARDATDAVAEMTTMMRWVVEEAQEDGDESIPETQP